MQLTFPKGSGYFCFTSGILSAAFNRAKDKTKENLLKGLQGIKQDVQVSLLRLFGKHFSFSHISYWREACSSDKQQEPFFQLPQPLQGHLTEMNPSMQKKKPRTNSDCSSVLELDASDKE